MPRHLPLPKGNEKVWRELLPAADVRQHGRHVYMFRNTQTNQIVYTLNPRIEQRTLKQLPFITKKSVPARIRPDLWEAHCRIGPFPVPKQGMDAFKKLRELRKLHELYWDKTNPDYKELPKKKLLWKIMDQRANASADLAKVLQIQKQVADDMRLKKEARDAEQAAYLKKKWGFYEGLAEKVKAGEDLKLEQRVQTLKSELKNKAGDEAVVQKIERKIAHAEHDIKQMRSAGRLVAKREAKQAEIDVQYSKDLAKHTREVAALEKRGKTEEAEMLRELTPQKPENDYIKRILPYGMEDRDASFSLDTIQCDWADLLDAEYAAGQWPENVTHGTLLKAEGTLRILTGEEYRDQIRQDKDRIEQETLSILETIKRDAENARRAAAGLPPLEIKKVEEPVEEPKTGLAKYTSWVKNPFKRASA